MWAFNIYIEICRTCGGVVERFMCHGIAPVLTPYDDIQVHYNPGRLTDYAGLVSRWAEERLFSVPAVASAITDR